MANFLASIGIGIACGLLLNIFYIVVKHEWPFSYFGIGGTVDPIASRNLFRYTLFRFTPPATASIAATLTAERMGGYPIAALTATLTVHCLRLVASFIREARACRWLHAIGRLLIALLIVATSFTATLFREHFSGLVPHPSELVANLWAGLLAAIGAIYLQQVAMVRKSPESTALKSLSEIPVTLLEYAAERCIRLRVDPRIFLAIMVTENMQRPQWFRAIENRWPGNKQKRTLGIMQQRGSRSDIHSIELALGNHVIPHLPLPEGESDYELLTRITDNYNTGQPYKNLIEGIYYAFLNDEECIEKIDAIVRQAEESATQGTCRPASSQASLEERQP